MSCTPAPTCKAALAQASARWPGRRTSSDGVCASAKHSSQNPTSDHETGNAFDLSHDPDHGVDTYDLAERMRRNPDPRVKYVISNGRIWNPSISTNWRPYTGSNRHDHHMHVSIVLGARGDTSDWWSRYYPSTSQQEDLLMAAAKDDDDARWALVLQWFVDYLGRVPTDEKEHALHVWVFGTKGAGACLSGIVNSTEAQAYRKMQRV